MIVENLLLNLMFEVPSDPTIKEVIVGKECITSHLPPTIRHVKEA